MVARAGEKAWETGDFVCQKCNEKVHVRKGHKIPRCPNCSSLNFDERINEPAHESR